MKEAIPFLEEAKRATEELDEKAITEITSFPNPFDVIKRVMDCVLIMLNLPIQPVTPASTMVKKKPVTFIQDSYKINAKPLMLKTSQFMSLLNRFNEEKLDHVTDETIELIMPYFDMPDFNQADTQV